MREGLFGYRCSNPGHHLGLRDASMSRGPTITIYDKQWAYCASEATDGHSWQRIDLSSLDEVRRQTPLTIAGIRA
jgi:hypothetical protein